MRTLVIGGGIAGLAAAHRLHQRGDAVELWDAGKEPGGWARTLPWGEGRMELGPSVLALWPGSALERLLGELGLPWRPVPPARRWAIQGGKAHPLPSGLGGWMRSPLLSPAGKLRMAVGMGLPAKPRSGEDLEAYTRRWLGQEAATCLLPLLSATRWAAPPHRVCAAVAGDAFRSGGVRLVVPLGGMGALPQALARRIPKQRRAHPALALERGEALAWRAVGPGGIVEAERIVLALPAFEAARLLAPHAPGPARALEAIPYLSLGAWHSRHPSNKALAGDFGCMADPASNSGFLGSLVSTTLDPDCAPRGSAQLRTLIGGGYALDPELERWENLEPRLRRWWLSVPSSQDRLWVPMEKALPLPEPGHGERVQGIQRGLPRGLEWIGFGPGIPRILEGVEAWAGEGRK